MLAQVPVPSRLAIFQAIAALAALFSVSLAEPALAVDYLKGFDVYSGDGAVTWSTAKNAGYPFAFVKSTEGINFVDSRFNANMQNSKTAGVYVGPYHICRVDSRNGVKFTSYDGQPFQPGSDPYEDATSEAADFLAAIKPYYLANQYLPPVADIETAHVPDFGSTSLERTFVSNWVQLFSDSVYASLGVRPLVYASKSNANTNYTSSVASSHKLWLAWWKGTGTSSPPVQSDTPLWNRWQFWQYAVDELVPGVPGSNNGETNPDGSVKRTVDTNVFEGSIDDLKKLLLGKDSAIPGDYNRDGKVDTADYVVWRNSMGQKVPLYTGADGNGNATVDAADFGIWKANFGKSSGAGAEVLDGASVPEPTAISLIAILLTGLAMASRLFFNRGQ